MLEKDLKQKKVFGIYKGFLTQVNSKLFQSDEIFLIILKFNNI